MKIGFGKYRDTELDDVPANYLLWLYEQDGFAERNPAINKYIEENMRGLKKQQAEGAGEI